MKVDFVRVWAVRAAAILALTTAAWSGTFGKVVPISGQASDIALDESRGVLYIANFTANTIDVMSLADNTIGTSFNVPPQPGALALSPDGQYLVVAHFGNFANAPANAITVINLGAGNTRQTFALGFPPLGVAFGIDGQCFVVTSTNFLLLDPVSGATQTLDTIANVAAKTLPVAGATFPPNIITAALNISADGLWIYGLTDTLTFSYDVRNKQVRSQSYTSSPTMGPRAVSVSDDGSYFLAGWALQTRSIPLLQEFPGPAGLLNIGGHAIDSRLNLIYAEIPSQTAATTSPIPTTPVTGGTTPSTGGSYSGAPILGIYDADNLTVREQINLQEHLGGKSVLTAAHDVMYAVSDSGVTVLPVGSLNKAHRVRAQQEDIVFRGNFCNRAVATQTLTITDPGGGNTEFALSVNGGGIALFPSSGVTPATVTVAVDPNSYANQKGTSVATITIRSSSAINIPPTVRVLINTKDPDQRGTFINIPGKLVDLLADPARNRYYVLRQDKNQVLVFDGASNQQIATLRTGNTPTMLAMTFDNQLLMIGHDDSQVIYVYDLNTLKPQLPVVMPFGHYPRSIAASGNAILASVRSASGPNAVDRIDLPSRTASMLSSLGIFTNSIPLNSVLTAAPNGANILLAGSDGTVMLYDANADTWVASRKDLSSLGGSFAASSYGQYLVDNNLLNSSLVPIKKFDNSTGSSSGFAFIDQGAYRTTISSASGPGIVQRVDLTSGGNVLPTRMVEAPLSGTTGFAFVRTLAPLATRTAFVALTVSGVTVLPWNYDAAVAPPQITQLVNAADQTSPVAPGGLINVMGNNLSPVNVATNEVPLPTALADSCLTVNGIPVPVLFVSSNQINAQLPFNVDGNATMVLRTPGGVSDNYLFSILPAAPSVFRSGTAGPDTGIATIVRQENNELVTPTNPIHPGDTLAIYATGLGRTNPTVDAGVPVPSDPQPVALIPPVVTLGGAQLITTFAGLSPGQIGVYEIDVTVPKGGVPEGMPIPLVIKQGGSATQIDVRVVK